MLHSDKLTAKRALDTRPRGVPTFLPGDMVAVWRMMKGGGIPGKRAHHRWRLGMCMESGARFLLECTFGSIKTSPEQLRPAAREERHAWALGGGRTAMSSLVTSLRTSRTVNVLEIDEEEPADEDTVQSRHPSKQEIHPTVVVESLERPRFLMKIPTKCAVKCRE